MKVTDSELIARVQRGDNAAFSDLVSRHDQRVLSIAASYTKDPDEAKDIYQEVFLRVYRSLQGFEFRSEFSTWLYRIVTNVCLTFQMRNKKRQYVSLDGEMGAEVERAELVPVNRSHPISPDRHAQSVEIGHYIDDAMGSLSPQQRMVFTLKHYEGYKLREIASMMDCSEGTVKKYLFTATDRMRKRLRKIF